MDPPTTAPQSAPVPGQTTATSSSSSGVKLGTLAADWMDGEDPTLTATCMDPRTPLAIDPGPSEAAEGPHKAAADQGHPPDWSEMDMDSCAEDPSECVLMERPAAAGAEQTLSPASPPPPAPPAKGAAEEAADAMDTATWLDTDAADLSEALMVTSDAGVTATEHPVPTAAAPMAAAAAAAAVAEDDTAYLMDTVDCDPSEAHLSDDDEEESP